MKAEIILTDNNINIDLNEPTIDVSTEDGFSITIIGGVGPQGDRGPEGPKGEKGDDYVLTEDDLVEIADKVDLSSYVQKNDWANPSDGGVVKVSTGAAYGITMGGNDHILRTALPSAAQIKSGAMAHTPITPQSQHEAVFYGLAKIAGQDEKDSALPVGQYTEAAKTAIQAMIDVPAKTDIPDVPVQEVQINGSSIVTDGIANIPIVQSRGEIGAARINYRGLTFHNDPFDSSLPKVLGIDGANVSACKVGNSYWAVLVPQVQHAAAFYGLAKAAGADMASSDNPVGTYTDEAKTAIRAMLGLDDQTIVDIVQAGLPAAEEVSW